MYDTIYIIFALLLKLIKINDFIMHDVSMKACAHMMQSA